MNGRTLYLTDSEDEEHGPYNTFGYLKENYYSDEESESELYSESETESKFDMDLNASVCFTTTEEDNHVITFSSEDEDQRANKNNLSRPTTKINCFVILEN